MGDVMWGWRDGYGRWGGAGASLRGGGRGVGGWGVGRIWVGRLRLLETAVSNGWRPVGRPWRKMAFSHAGVTFGGQHLSGMMMYCFVLCHQRPCRGGRSERLNPILWRVLKTPHVIGHSGLRGYRKKRPKIIQPLWHP